MNKAKQILLDEARKLKYKSTQKQQEANKLLKEAKELEVQAEKIE